MIQAGKLYDSSAAELQSQVNHQKKFHEKNVEHYKQARDAYLKRVEETVDFLKKEGISGAAKLAADTVVARVEDAKQLPAYVDKEAKVQPHLTALLEVSCDGCPDVCSGRVQGVNACQCSQQKLC